jgi:hypothetical protein
MNNKIVRVLSAAVLTSAAVLAGPAVAHAQDCPSVGVRGEGIPLTGPANDGRGMPSGGAGGIAVGEASATLTDESQNSGDHVEAQVCAQGKAHPDKNVMIIQQETYDGPVDLTGVVVDFDWTLAGNTFDVFVFDTGTFTNTGDQGWENWGFSGTFTRSEDGRTVTFTG